MVFKVYNHEGQLIAGIMAGSKALANAFLQGRNVQYAHIEEVSPENLEEGLIIDLFAPTWSSEENKSTAE